MEKKTIYRKLVDVQIKLKAPKGQYNKFGDFMYRSCEDVLESVKPILSENGLALILTDDIVVIGDNNYLRATCTLIDVDTGDTVNNTALAREVDAKKGMDGSQLTGVASSYARKYALNGLFLIDDTKDADTDQFTQQKNKAKQEQEKKDKKVIDILKRSALEFGFKEKDALNAIREYKVKYPSDLTNTQINEIINRMKVATEKKKADAQIREAQAIDAQKVEGKK